ncbi:MAG TPA: DUF928 domain-containing protein [Stenomitos sp.]
MVIKSYPRLTTVSLALSLELALSSLLPATAMYPSTQQQPPAFSQREFLAQRRSRLKFKVPGIRPSRNLEGGAARGGCGSVGGQKMQMKALQPESNIGLTTVGKPTFYFQISSTSVEEAKFLLLNAKGDTIIYEQTFPLTKTGGIKSFTLPADAEALQPGTEYTWELVANCDPEDQKGNPRVQGSIKRVQPEQKFLSDLARVSMRDRVALYAEAGYWYDSLKTLADLRSANPNNSDLISDWQDLLESVGLGKVAKEPLL